MMSHLITTARALHELAGGMAPSAIGTSDRLLLHTDENARVLLHYDDSATTQRVVVAHAAGQDDLLVPEHLKRLRKEVAGRLANFAERALSLPLTLPRSWGQFRRNSYLTFFVTPSGAQDRHSSRCIVEVSAFGAADVVLWHWTTNDHQIPLDEVTEQSSSIEAQVDRAWRGAIAALATEKADRDRIAQANTYIDLDHQPHADDRLRTFDQWMSSVSPDQKAFIDASTDTSIKLRGPAGSGKTLALTLKAVKEALADDNDRVLVVTHSWGLASDIQDQIDRLGVPDLPNLEVFPLLAIARELSPRQLAFSDNFSVIGSDSLSGKQAQLDEILDVLQEFVTGDWVTYRSTVSEGLRNRVDSDDADVRFALAWDLLIEFGSVIGAAGIFPGAGADLRYKELPRSPWMLELSEAGDYDAVYALYSDYMRSLEERSLETGDQVLADFLQYLESHGWNRGRRNHGYDLIFVDEFHLFSPLERQVLHYLTRDTARYPRLFMALDPRQSPAEALIGGASDSTSALTAGSDDPTFGRVENFDLATVHRFTPQILELVKHLHHSFPSLNLGDDWHFDLASVDAAGAPGPQPKLIVAPNNDEEFNEIYSAVRDLYSKGRIALAVVDSRQWPRFSQFAGDLAKSEKYHVVQMSGRTDAASLGYRKQGVMVAPAEFLAGLQFETVLVAGLPDLRSGAVPIGTERTRLLSLLYLAVSRAETQVRIFTSDDQGGVPEVLSRARELGVIQ